MKINKLSLKNFRNYETLDIKFNEKLNIIIGNNAQGKTNILEAIYFISLTKSNFLVNDKNCIKKDQLFTKINADITEKKQNKKLSLLLNANGKKLEINGNEVKKHADYIGNLRVIMFNPDNIRLIKDSPGNRRRFLNIELSQLNSNYLNILNEYNAVLKQRNEYLKVIKFNKINEVYFDILTEKLVDLAVGIYNMRINFISNINIYIGKIFNKIAGYSNLKIKFLPSIDVLDADNIKQLLLDKIKSSYEREIFHGNTLYGPHRDDFCFDLDGNDLLLYGSQGQQKMAILALKLAAVDVFYDDCGEYPVLLLDDLFSELDVDKRNKIISYLNRNIQTIITTTDLNSIDDELISRALIFKIADGKIINEIQEGCDLNG